MNFREFLNSKFEFDIILANLNKPIPPFPFATFQILNENRNTGLEHLERTELPNDLVEIKQNKRVENVAQIDVYGLNVVSTDIIMHEIVDGIQWKYREEINYNGFGIIDISDITDLSELKKTTVKYRKSVAITYDYLVENTRTTENTQMIIFNDIEVGR